MVKNLVLENVSVGFKLPQGVFYAVDDVSLNLHGGNFTAIIGESGCGKSVLGQAILNILPSGVIKKGNRADLAVVDFNRPHLVPCHDVLANLVFSAQGSDVVLTMVDGDVIYRDGKYKTVDINKVYDKISYYLPKILEKI